jgi:hypothetical protein
MKDFISKNIKLNSQRSNGVLVIGNFGNGNLGDEIILLGLLYKYLRYRSIRLFVSVADFHTFKEYHPIVSKYISIFKSSPIVGYIYVIPALIRSRKVIIVGGHYLGNFFDISLLTYIAILGRLLRKEILLESVGLYPYATRVGFNISKLLNKKMNSKYKLSVTALFLTKLLLALANNISVRDISTKILVNQIIGRKVFLELEASFNLPMPSLVTRNNRNSNKHQLWLGLAIGYIADSRFPKIVKELFSAIIHLMKCKQDLKVICIPFSIPIKEDMKSVDNDLRLCLQLYTHLPDELRSRFIVVKERLNPLEAIYLLSKLDCIVTLRYHSFILASRLGVPCITIPHELKVVDYIDFITKYKLGNGTLINVIMPEDVSVQRLLEAFKKCVEVHRCESL